MTLPKQLTSLLVLTVIPYLRMASADGKEAQAKSGSTQSDQFNRDLQELGEKLAKAVLAKDVPTLLKYDREDLRSQDEAALKNARSELYCSLFDSSCISDRKWRSVYDKLSQAHKLAIKVAMSSSPYDHKLYGSLIFYDSSSISDKALRSSAFLCKNQATKLVSWKFQVDGDKWKAVTPLFDTETEGLCAE